MIKAGDPCPTHPETSLQADDEGITLWCAAGRHWAGLPSVRDPIPEPELPTDQVEQLIITDAQVSES